MGVPKFYRWISERYPCLSEVIKEYQIPDFDNLYLDMNGIIHVCSHPNDDDPHFRISEEKIFADICHYLDFLCKMIKPKKVFFMAVDGVAPRAKMNQQRGRRFRTAKSAEILEQKAKSLGEVLPTEARFDSNCITPGTVFMAKLHEVLKGFIQYKISTDKLWQNIRIYLSGHETPGEGEHKIMDFIRYEKSQNNYDPNTRHCLYGLDADLLMLGLASHEPHFSLLREEVRFGKKESQKRIMCPEEMTFHLLHLSLLREYLGHEFSPVREKIKFEFDMEKIIDDFVLMSFLVGNDFIPNLPQLHIRNCALPILFKTYIDVLPNLGGYINEGGTLNLKRFELFFEKLSEYDYEKFGESSEFPPPGNRNKNETEGNCSNKSQDFEKLVDLGFSALSLEKTTEYDSSSDEDSDGALFELEFNQHKMDYYRNKLEYETVTMDVLREQAEGYVRAIQWNLHYYYNGIVSWSWYYPHHYAPYISDVKNFSDMDMEFEMSEPFSPFQQLLAVLPVLSKVLLPPSYQSLMAEEDSPMRDCYPEDFDTDLNGKQHEWEAVVLIPFINEKLLLKCSREADKRSSAEELRRNQHGPHLLYTYTDISQGYLPSFLSSYFPPVESNHSKCQLLDKNVFRLPIDCIFKGLCPGVFLDVHFPGFPTLKHINHTAKLSNEKVKVFQMASQRDSMMLTITEQVESDIDKVAKLLVGQVTYTSWPHLQEGFVVGVASEDVTYTWDGGKTVKSETDSAIWTSQMKSIHEHYHKRLGIFIGDIDSPILVHVKSFIGSKMVSFRDGKVKEEKQWTQSVSTHAFQTTIKDLSICGSVAETSEKYSDLYAKGSIVFMLSEPYYACMGIIVDHDSESQNKKISVEVELLKEPSLRSIIKNQEKYASQTYRPGYEIAKCLCISGNFLARITGTFLVQTNSKESISPNMANVGLNLKFNRKNEEVAGFSKKNEYNEWVYSEKVLSTLNSYMCEFPDFFDRVIPFARKDVIYLEDVYPDGGGAEVISQIVKWLKSQQCSTAERQTCGNNTLDTGIVLAIEAAVGRNQGTKETKLITVDPHVLFNPLFCKGCVLPDPNATFEIFDRVINVGCNIAPPLGLRGTIIGIRPADRVCDYVYEVVFDKEFFGGLTLQGVSRKGYRVSPSALLNITHAERQENSYSSPFKRVYPANVPSTSDFATSDQTNATVRNQNRRNHIKSLTQFTEAMSANSNFQPVKILSKNSKQPAPFYKVDNSKLPLQGFVHDSSNPPPFTTSNLSQHQFVSPKASHVLGKKSLEGTNSGAAESIPSSNFHEIWDELIKKQNAESLPKSNKTTENLGKAVTVEELFNAVDNHIKQKQKPPYEHPVPKKQTPVVELMNYCLQIYRSPPTYSYQEIAMTGCYISSLQLPDGQKFVSVQCPSQVSASENAAEMALIALQQKSQLESSSGATSMAQPTAFPDNYRSAYNDMPYQPVFPNVPVDTSCRLMAQPPPMTFVPPLPPQYNPYNVSLMRYPTMPVSAIPDSFVKQNQMMMTGQVPIQQFVHPPNVQHMIRMPPPPFVGGLKQEIRKEAPKDNVFVPLQVLRNTTRKLSEESVLLNESDWPALSAPAHPIDISPKQSTSNHTKKVDSDEIQTTRKSFNTIASSLKEPKKPSLKPRLAAVFPNM